MKPPSRLRLQIGLLYTAVYCSICDQECKFDHTLLRYVEEALVAAARKNGCGGRFTGAGAGGCIWAIGLPEKIDLLRKEWETITKSIRNARMLDVKIARRGVHGLCE